MDILAKIVAHTQALVARRKTERGLKQLQADLEANPRTRHSLKAALGQGRPLVIAEFKRKSPSKPDINTGADPVAVARAYAEGGAAAMSILTEPEFFAGSPDDLRAVRGEVSLPLLRKDFMIDPYQFYEARCMGADLVLLIARILDPVQLKDYCDLAHGLGLEVLCEIHNLDELAAVGDAEIDFLGVNCRDLKRFDTDIERSLRITAELPRHIPWVAESGIHGRDDLQRLFRAGYQLFLIGEYLMKSPDPAARLGELLRP